MCIGVLARRYHLTHTTPSPLGERSIRYYGKYSQWTSTLSSSPFSRYRIQQSGQLTQYVSPYGQTHSRVYSGTRSLGQSRWWNNILGKSKRKEAAPGTIPGASPRHSVCARATAINRVRHDDFAWLQDATDPETIKYLRAENKYSEWYMKDTEGLQHQLFEETLLVHPRESESLPERVDNYMYYTRTPDVDGALPIYCRRQRLGTEDHSLTMTGAEQVLIDQNILVQQCGYLMIESVKLSHDHTKLVFTMDSTGDESLSAVVLDLADGGCRVVETLPSVVSVEWASDGEHIMYTSPDHHGRPHEIRCHKLGTDSATDRVVFTESDESVFLDVSLTKDKRFITLNANSKMTSEVRVLDASTPHGEPLLIREREKGVEYFVEHRNDKFYIVTNIDGTETYKIISAPETAPQSENWCDFFQGETNEPIEDMDIYADYCVIYMRDKYGAPKMTIMDLDTRELRTAQLPSTACMLIPGANQTFKTHCLRLGLTSPSTPEVIVTCDLRDGSLTRHREITMPSLTSAYNTEIDAIRSLSMLTREDIEVRQMLAESTDGTPVPMTLIAKRGVLDQGSPSPLIVQGYGAYGHKLDADYRPERIPMLNRGFVYALCHVRGGGEFGKRWHRLGKLMNKHNSFEDLEACVRQLHSAGISQPSLTAVRGSSAGGLLTAAAVMRSPYLFKCAVMKVPFADVLTAMLDDTLALTVHEYDEWGNPSESKAIYDYIKSYCPYDNLRNDRHLPNMLFTGSMKDNRVPYWHPAKMVAKLRHLRSSNLNESRASPRSADFTGACGDNDPPLVGDKQYDKPVPTLTSGHENGASADRSGESMCLLQTDWDAGHFGAAGQEGYFSGHANENAFILKSLNLLVDDEKLRTHDGVQRHSIF